MELKGEKSAKAPPGPLTATPRALACAGAIGVVALLVPRGHAKVEVYLDSLSSNFRMVSREEVWRGLGPTLNLDHGLKSAHIKLPSRKHGGEVCMAFPGEQFCIF